MINVYTSLQFNVEILKKPQSCQGTHLVRPSSVKFQPPVELQKNQNLGFEKINYYKILS